LRLQGKVQEKKLAEWKLDGADDAVAASAATSDKDGNVKIALRRNFEFRLPLAWLLAVPVQGKHQEHVGVHEIAPASRLRVRFSLWRAGLPVDSLPLEGWIELQLVAEGELA
jgi:hypothetical protein